MSERELTEKRQRHLISNVMIWIYATKEVCEDIKDAQNTELCRHDRAEVFNNLKELIINLRCLFAGIRRYVIESAGINPISIYEVNL